MDVYKFGNPDSDIVLVDIVGEHNIGSVENEVSIIKSNTNRDFCLIAVKVDDWNRDLSPWKADAVFGREDFGGGAASTLNAVRELCQYSDKKYYIGGYSLAGLFALWAAYESDIFVGAIGASPSIWFPGFIDYMKNNEFRSSQAYLSLGDREHKVRNSVMSTVRERIIEASNCLQLQGIDCILEWNQGNHFSNTDIRVAKGFSWALNID